MAAPTSGRQDDNQRGHLADLQAGDRKASCWSPVRLRKMSVRIFLRRWPQQLDEKTAHSLCAGTLGRMAPTN